MTLLSDFLKELGVPHTETYSDNAFKTMSFKSLFGFSRLLDSYGVKNEALRLNDNSQLIDLPIPFVARDKDNFVIVTSVDSGNDKIHLLRFGKKESVSLSIFQKRMPGIVLIAYRTQDSREPDYSSHRFHELADKAKQWILILCSIFLIIAGYFIGLYQSLSTSFLLLVDLAGVAVTWLLLLKTLKVKSKSADRICGVLEEHGCDHVLEQKASTFFGIFSWSEVGITYFSLSALFLLVFPSQIHCLALINACCLPFTVWSIWYQKFRIKTWCTLCVTTQCLLWLQFLCYLLGGWWHRIFPLRMSIFMMIAAYAATLMAINKVMNFIKNKN